MNVKMTNLEAIESHSLCCQGKARVAAENTHTNILASRNTGQPYVCIYVYLCFQLYVRALAKGSQFVGRGKSLNPKPDAFERKRKEEQSRVMGMGGDTKSFVLVFC